MDWTLVPSANLLLLPIVGCYTQGKSWRMPKAIDFLLNGESWSQVMESRIG